MKSLDRSVRPGAPAVALTLAGSDPSGGAGLQADLKTFHQHRVYGTAVVTLLTVQNTLGVRAVRTMDPSLVRDQIDALLDDVPPQAAKTGALGDCAIVEVVADCASGFTFPLVVDPVMISKHGAPLLSDRTVEVLRERLLPHTYLLTPNLPEARRLAGWADDRHSDDPAAMRDLALTLLALGPRHVLLKGGHRRGSALDLLVGESEPEAFEADRIETSHTHGTGCVLSAAITARLARGEALRDAVRGAKDFVHRAIRNHPAIGSGTGPIDLFQAP